MTLATHISGITKIMKYIKYKIIKKTLYVKALYYKRNLKHYCNSMYVVLIHG